jgi:type VI secretion system secreted protein Hcp
MSIEYFLKFDPVKGESKQDKHKDEIELLGWSFSGHNPVSIGGSGMSAGKVDLAEISITKRADKASPKLLELLVTGNHVKEATLSLAKSTGGKSPEDFLTIKLTKVFVSSFQVGGSQGGEFETENISLAYQKIHYDYKEQQADGKLVSAGTVNYDIAERKAG